MHFDLTISIHIDTFGRTAGLPTLDARLSARAFDLVGMTSPAARAKTLARVNRE